MKTNDLIGLLALGAGEADPADDAWRLGIGAILALPVMVAAVAAGLGLLPMSLWQASATLPKLAYALVLMLGGVTLLRMSGRPGSRLALPALIIAVTLAAATIVGVGDLLRQDPAVWATHILGHSAPICPFAILALSVPALIGTVRAARSLAPTRLRLTGAAAGMAAGGLAAFAYSLGCTEGALTFVAVWYTAGVALATLLGAAIGPRFLRW